MWQATRRLITWFHGCWPKMEEHLALQPGQGELAPTRPVSQPRNLASTMLAQAVQELSLEDVMAVPGVGAQVLSSLPIPERVRLRQTCRAFREAVDDSLEALTELFGDDVAMGCRPGYAGLSWLLTKCPNLRMLSVAARSDCQEPWQERDHLSLTWPYGSLDTIAPHVLSLGHVARRCQRLKYLNVAGCCDVTDASVVELVGICPGLESLDVSNTDVSDLAISTVAKACGSSLRRLALSHCLGITDAALAEVALYCGGLTELFVDGTRVKDAGIAAVATSCTSLRRLVVPHRVNDRSIGLVARCCPRLEHLGVTGCKRVTDSSIVSIASACPRLRRLDATASVRLTDESAFALAENCPGLQRLRLRYTRVSDAGIKAVARSCEELRHLDVGGCNSVTDDGVGCIAGCCQRLQHLSVHACRSVTDASICQVAKNCSRLQSLDVSRTAITAVGISAIASCCHELLRLDMRLSGQAGGRSLATLADGCPRLEFLDVSVLG
eukprot:jgi/Mesvir1/17558/Mv08803-RA.1